MTFSNEPGASLLSFSSVGATLHLLLRSSRSFYVRIRVDCGRRGCSTFPCINFIKPEPLTFVGMPVTAFYDSSSLYFILYILTYKKKKKHLECFTIKCTAFK